MSPNPKNCNVDNVRVVKIMGGSLAASRVVRGMVFGREPEGKQYFLPSNSMSHHGLRNDKKRKKGQGRSLHLRAGYSPNRDEGYCLDQERRRDVKLYGGRREASREG